MAFDYKKEYREFYLPPRKPGIICVPEMRFAAVRGHGDPNEEGGDYQHALSMLYAVRKGSGGRMARQRSTCPARRNFHGWR